MQTLPSAQSRADLLFWASLPDIRGSLRPGDESVKVKRRNIRAQDKALEAVSADRERVHHKKENHKSAHHKSAPRRRAPAKNRHRRHDRRVFVNVRLRPKDIPAAQALVLEQIMEHGGPTEACVQAGVGRATFYDWLQEPEFRKAYNNARKIWRASVIGDVERSFVERSQVRDTLAGIFLLKHNTKRYREVSRVELSGRDGGPIVTLEAKEELIRRLEKLAGSVKPDVKAVVGGVEVRERGPLSVVRSGSRDDGEEPRRVRRVRGLK